MYMQSIYQIIITLDIKPNLLLQYQHRSYHCCYPYRIYNVNVELHLRTSIPDINDQPHIGTYSRFVILKLVVDCLQLATQYKICSRYYQGLFFLIKKYLVMSVIKITKCIQSKIACDFLFFSCFFVTNPKLWIQILLLEVCIQYKQNPV